MILITGGLGFIGLNTARAFIDAGEDGGHPYIVFEHVKGETLKDRIRREGPLPIAEAIAYAIELGAEPRRLTAYTFDGDGDEGSLFVPFVDATSGSDTYGAGRYLDIEREDDGTYTLDFNLAYHPSCVYDAIYSCPLTPAENRLPVRVEAGERLPEGYDG